MAVNAKETATQDLDYRRVWRRADRRVMEDVIAMWRRENILPAGIAPEEHH
mgnify:FL=1